MLAIVKSNRFLKDVELAKKRGFDIFLLEKVVKTLASEELLPDSCHDHALIGNYSDFRECHIKPDWLLIYSKDEKELELFLFRTGTHSDLFK